MASSTEAWTQAKVSRRSLLAAAGAVGAAVAVGAPAHASDQARDAHGSHRYVDVQLLSITDWHGFLLGAPGDHSVIHGRHGRAYEVGGAAYMAAHLKRLRDGRRNSIFFSAGDNFSGWQFDTSIFCDEPTIEALNLMGLEFSTAGNHEFDRSPAMITQHMEEGVPFLVVGRDASFVDSSGRLFRGANFSHYSANVKWLASGASVLPGCNIRYVIGPCGRNIPIGFIHVTTIGTPRFSTSYLPAVTATSEIEAINRIASRLRAQGVNAIVLSMHEGADADGDFTGGVNPSGPAYEIALRASPDIDVIIAGHWHTQFNIMLPDPLGRLRPFVEAGCYGQLINEINLKIDPLTGGVVRELTVSTNHPNSRTTIAPDPEMQKLVSYWQRKATRRADSVIGRQSGSFLRTRNDTGQSPMGDLIADWALWAGRRPSDRARDGNRHRNVPADLALVPTAPRLGESVIVGGLIHDRARNGAITFAQAWQAVGYGNPIVTAWVTGTQIHDALEQQWTTRPDGLIQYSPLAVSGNVHYSFNPLASVGSRVEPDDVVIGGVPLAPGKRYRLAALAYTFLGDDGYPALTSCEEPYTHERDFESFVSFVRQAGTLSPLPTNRVTALYPGDLVPDLGEIVEPIAPLFPDGTERSRQQAAIVATHKPDGAVYPPC
ncbi:bifunctional metallophosphatase/5'-nucleotidase [Streptomyces sp. NBC_01264]|uniref:bifunctional metallophosphatase/5'-nucleotidase n=1 Tax=Streptomyces sp. NBC_01264 TaxID=2903804 RepID=UPI002254202B|nr:bifunctional UDP-sugar hydrolase/5'-nucleotidase [Streptomyces sp. NBC_01264]MCX4775940.1 bifunctional metallophosphatase/5'-nucleotidase [Streptomyces sp. NBC_01264]